MTILYSFPPIADAQARVLILGTMPGAASLEAGQYYAHPRNLFWPIMGELFGAGLDLPYAERLRILKAKHIAVWDVFAACVRAGSLDSAITQEVVNDFPAFFAAHPLIRLVVFDSGTAETAFNKIVRPTLAHLNLSYARVPSPSPAHAALSFEQKLERWRGVLNF